jgi:hypothetical protein
MARRSAWERRRCGPQQRDGHGVALGDDGDGVVSEQKTAAAIFPIGSSR